MVAEVEAARPEIVLIGCGGLGMVLGAELKKRGFCCVVMGGAIQNLFGIKGRRWKDHSIIGGFWNGSWVSPLESEVPEGAGAIEGGCYWI